MYQERMNESPTMINASMVQFESTRKSHGTCQEVENGQPANSEIDTSYPAQNLEEQQFCSLVRQMLETQSE